MKLTLDAETLKAIEEAAAVAVGQAAREGRTAAAMELLQLQILICNLRLTGPHDERGSERFRAASERIEPKFYP